MQIAIIPIVVLQQVVNLHRTAAAHLHLVVQPAGHSMSLRHNSRERKRHSVSRGASRTSGRPGSAPPCCTSRKVLLPDPGIPGSVVRRLDILS